MMETFVWELLCVIHVTHDRNYFELYIHVLKVRSLLLLKEKKRFTVNRSVGFKHLSLGDRQVWVQIPASILTKLNDIVEAT